MKKLTLTICLIFGLFIAPMAMADTVTFVGGYGPYQSGSGGEFTVKPSDGLKWVLDAGYVEGVTRNVQTFISTFQTFCVEHGENVWPNATYTAVLNNSSVEGGVGGQDPLSKGAAWLYHQFQIGRLEGYDYTRTRVGGILPQTEALQAAIWAFEDEVGGLENTFFNAAVTYFGNETIARENNFNGTTRAIPVMVLNLYEGTNLRQDVLVCVPEPGILILLGIAMSAVGLAARRFKI